MQDALSMLRQLDPWSAHVLDAIATERLRQIEGEGWTAQHDDDEHKNGEMACAAAGYARLASTQARRETNSGGALEPEEPSGDPVPVDWPWDDEWWKPRNAASNLKRAGALIVAEMARRLRAASFRTDLAKANVSEGS